MHISYSSCAKTMTNVFFKYISILSRRMKGKWSIRQRQGFHSNSDGITYPLPLLIYLSIGITFHSYFFINGQESKKGLQRSLLLAIHAKGGENIKPKAKGPHHRHFKKIRNEVLIDIFHIGI
jgi:hypothetical protein